MNPYSVAKLQRKVWALARKPKTVPETIASRVEAVRERRGYSLRELSRRLDEVGHSMDATALMRLERGERRITIDDLLAVALALDVPPVALFVPIDTGEAVRVTADMTMDPLQLLLWVSGEGPPEADYMDAYGDLAQAQEAARPFVLWRDMLRHQEEARDAYQGMRAAHVLEDEDVYRREHRRFVEHLRAIAEAGRLMVADGITPPPLDGDWLNAMDDLGLDYPEEGK